MPNNVRKLENDTKNHPSFSDASCHATLLTVFDKIKLYHHLTTRVSQYFQTKLHIITTQ